MAVPGHQDTVAWPGAGTDRSENAGGAAIYQKMGFLASIEPGGSFLCFLQDAVCVVQVVEAVYFGNIDGGWVAEKCRAPFVAGHVERIGIRGAVCGKGFVYCHGIRR